jgi:hypothetical protein
MDASHIAEDRRAISKKLRRHQMQKQSSKRQGGFEMTSQMIPNEENFNEADYEELNENLDDVQYDDFDSGDYNDSIGVLQSTLSKEGSKRSLSYSGHPGTNRQESSRLRRHTSTRSPIVDCVFNIPQIGFDIPTTQSKKKTFTSILYILLCAALLVSYAFFLESCKLMNYGT